MRFKKDSLSQLAREVPIMRVAEHLGIKTNKRGGTVKILCPAHADKHPSCTLSKNKKFFYCYACNTAISQYDLLCYYGVTGTDAIEVLAELSGHKDDFLYRPAKTQRTRRKEAMAAPLTDAEQRLLGIQKMVMTQKGITYRGNADIRLPEAYSSERMSKEDGWRAEEEGYIKYETSSFDPWYELRKSPALFKRIVRNLCMQRIEKIQSMQNKVTGSDLEMVFDRMLVDLRTLMARHM